ncbi:hypothetical protein U3A55_04450 [Salarchaeum sp. III]|uniref:hypothetical protein n=1 Tax=Salarchaeum sp. III TaxID=3107927 RepID=UPI002ED87263
MRELERSLIGVVKFIVYFIFFLIGTGILLNNPASIYQAIPVLIGVALLTHAAVEDDFRRVEYTLIGLFLSIGIGVILIGVLTAVSIQLPDVLIGDLSLSVGLTGVISILYLVQSSDTDIGSERA